MMMLLAFSFVSISSRIAVSNSAALGADKFLHAKL